MESRTVQEIGNSLGVTIPKRFCKNLDIRKGDLIILKLTPDGKLIIQKINEPKQMEPPCQTSPKSQPD